MEIEIIEGDLFSTDTQYLAHCISSDFVLGAGIAVEFVKRFDMRNKLYKNYEPCKVPVGKSLLIDNVFNLVTKDKCWQKPSYENLKRSLLDMKEQCWKNYITEIAMPKIGCGLDKLEWDKVSLLLLDVFKDTNIKIKVYVKGENK